MEIPYLLVFAILAMGVVFLWISLVIWVWFDSNKYFQSFVFRFFFAFTTLVFGFIGLIVYLLFRYSRLENNGAIQGESELESLGIHLCSRCNAANSIENHFCRKCGFRLQKKCKGCNSYVGVEDSFCFECGAALKKEVYSPVQKNKVENFAQLGYIRDVFSKTFASLISFFKAKKSKNHKNKKAQNS